MLHIGYVIIPRDNISCCRRPLLFLWRTRSSDVCDSSYLKRPGSVRTAGRNGWKEATRNGKDSRPPSQPCAPGDPERKPPPLRRAAGPSGDSGPHSGREGSFLRSHRRYRALCRWQTGFRRSRWKVLSAEKGAGIGSHYGWDEATYEAWSSRGDQGAEWSYDSDGLSGENGKQLG